LKTKLNGRHFDTSEVVEAEWQAVLNTLTHYDFQYAFKNWKNAGKGAYAPNGTASRAIVTSRTKVSF
jgi:hypothetical protein